MPIGTNLVHRGGTDDYDIVVPVHGAGNATALRLVVANALDLLAALEHALVYVGDDATDGSEEQKETRRIIKAAIARARRGSEVAPIPLRKFEVCLRRNLTQTATVEVQAINEETARKGAIASEPEMPWDDTEVTELLVESVTPVEG